MSADRRRRVRLRARLAPDWTDDAGQVGGVEVLPFCLLVFVAGALIVTNAWAVVDVKLAANAASRQAVRAFVEAPDEPQAVRDADRAARDAIAGHGRNPARLTVDPPDYRDGGFRRCAEVTIHVSYPVPAITVPLVGAFGSGLVVTSSHTERIDPYRSGTYEDGTC